MIRARRIKGIIFDMDNTLLRSRIDYDSMKKETYQFLTARNILPAGYDLTKHTTATIINEALGTGSMPDAMIRDMWEIAKRHEIEGMRHAGLEPGVTELLARLKGRFHLAVVTNNAVEAAERALSGNGILDVFDVVVGREMVLSMKPSPDGNLLVLQKFPQTSPEEWLSVGDSWIDGKAAADAGMTFAAYRADSAKLNFMGVHPLSNLSDIRDVLHIVDD